MNAAIISKQEFFFCDHSSRRSKKGVRWGEDCCEHSDLEFSDVLLNIFEKRTNSKRFLISEFNFCVISQYSDYIFICQNNR